MVPAARSGGLYRCPGITDLAAQGCGAQELLAVHELGVAVGQSVQPRWAVCSKPAARVAQGCQHAVEVDQTVEAEVGPAPFSATSASTASALASALQAELPYKVESW